MTSLILLSVLLSQTAPAMDADGLFKSAREAMAKRDYAEACPLFERSHQAEAALGTLLNLADCYEKLGRTASAWLRFNEARDWAKRNRETQRENYAQQRAAALKPRLSYVAVRVEKPLTGMMVWLDEQALPGLETPQSFPVDLGEHVVRAVAPYSEEWSTKVHVEAAGSSTEVTVPTLVSNLEPPPVHGLLPMPAVSAKPPALDRSGPIVVIAAGAAILAAGVAGLTYSSAGYARFQKQQDGGPDELRPTVSRSEFNRLHALYPASWAITGVGAAVLTTGISWMVLRTSDAKASVSLAAAPAPNGGAISLGGSF